jgi:hypothetical protein
MVIGDVVSHAAEFLKTEPCISAGQDGQKRHKQITQQQFAADSEFHLFQKPMEIVALAE